MLYQQETGKARNCPMFGLQMSESGLGGVLITVKKGLRTAEALFTLEEKVSAKLQSMIVQNNPVSI